MNARFQNKATYVAALITTAPLQLWSSLHIVILLFSLYIFLLKVYLKRSTLILFTVMAKFLRHHLFGNQLIMWHGGEFFHFPFK